MGRRYARSRRTLAGALAAGVAVAALAAGETGVAAGMAGASAHTKHHAKKMTTLSIDSIPSDGWSVVQLAIDKGFLRKEGINLKLVPILALVQEIPDLASGHLDIGFGAAMPVIEAASHGIPLRLIGGVQKDVTRPQGSAVEVVAAKGSGITSYKQLTGKTVGVNALGTPFVYWTRAAIDAAGGDSAKTHFIAIPPPAQVHALASGQVDALAALQPFGAEAVAAGGHNIGDPFQAVDGKSPDYVYWVTTAKFANSHKAALRRFLAGMKLAAAYANAHPKVAQQTISKVTKLSLAAVHKYDPLPEWTVGMNTAIVAKDARILLHYQVIPKAVKVAPLIDHLGS